MHGLRMAGVAVVAAVVTATLVITAGGAFLARLSTDAPHPSAQAEVIRPAG